MRHHPLTPMTDSNLVRCCSARPGAGRAGRLSRGRARPGGDRALCRAATVSGSAIVDALSDRTCWRLAPPPRTSRSSPAARASPWVCPRTSGAGVCSRRPSAPTGCRHGRREAILAGSCSAATLGQIERHRARHGRRCARPGSGSPTAAMTSRARSLFAERHLGEGPVLNLRVGAAGGGREGAGAAWPRAGRRHDRGGDGGNAHGLVERGRAAADVAGGETAGAVVGALGIKGLRIGPEIDPGVPWTTSSRRAAARARAEVRQLRRARLLPQRDRLRARREARAVCARRSRPSVSCIFDLGLAHGATGNISVRLEDGLLVTPTNSSLGRLDPARLARLDRDGRHIEGDPPSKEAFLHRACTRCARAPRRSCICTRPTRPRSPAWPGSTRTTAAAAHGLLRHAGRPAASRTLFPAGRSRLAAAVRSCRACAVLLANHGPVVAGKRLEAAVYAIEELEATAKAVPAAAGPPRAPPRRRAGAGTPRALPC